jgi:hypothetical protein
MPFARESVNLDLRVSLYVSGESTIAKPGAPVQAGFFGNFPDRVKTVSKLSALEPLGLALSKKQIPQIIENTKKCGESKEPLEPDGMRPRQVRYQAALRPDI